MFILHADWKWGSGIVKNDKDVSFEYFKPGILLPLKATQGFCLATYRGMGH